MKPNVILSKTSAVVTAGESRVSTSSSTTADSSTVSSSAPPQAASTSERQRSIRNVFFHIFLR